MDIFIYSTNIHDTYKHISMYHISIYSIYYIYIYTYLYIYISMHDMQPGILSQFQVLMRGSTH